MDIFNNASAYFVLISGDLLLKMTTILKELRIAQQRSKNNTANEWMEFTFSLSPDRVKVLDVVRKVTYNVQSVRRKKSIFSRECLAPTKKVLLMFLV